ncbi:hypothetical protein [Treponema sp. R80B11-R83G3]
MKCKYFDECSAPICPMDVGAAQPVWFADEPVCRLQDVPEWVKRQRKIAKIGASAIAGYFTLAMLERRCVIGKKMSGIDPDATDVERKTAEENWLCGHPTIKAITGVEREKLAERMRSLRSIRLEAEGEKPNSARGKTHSEEKKVKSYGKEGQGCFTPCNLNNGGGIKK